jgi:hypothetical protein
VSVRPRKSPRGRDRPGAASIFGSAKPTRNEVAAFLFANPDKVLRGARGKVSRLEGRGRRGSLAHLNTDDLLATIIVRVDRSLERGVLRTGSEKEFWAYVGVIGENAVLELLRTRSGVPLIAADLRSTKLASTGVAAADAVLRLSAILAIAPTDSDRGLLCFKARGASYALIAAATGRNQAALRKQWSKLRSFFREYALSRA